MKIGAKPSLEQVYKYALLHWLEQQHTHTHKQSFLLYIGRGDFQNLWSEKLIKPKDVIKAAIESDISNLKLRASKVESVDINWDEVENVLSNTIIGYCNYADFESLLSEYPDNNPSEIVVKLFGGLSSELKRRGLT